MANPTMPDTTDLKARLREHVYKLPGSYYYDEDYGCNEDDPESLIMAILDHGPLGRKVMQRLTAVGYTFVRTETVSEAADALDAKDRTIAGLREAFLETREFLSLLEPAVCDWSCPSKWRSGEPQPHSKLHHDLRDVLHKHETVAIALRDQRLARRMGAEFVPHDYDATPLKGQTP